LQGLKRITERKTPVLNTGVFVFYISCRILLKGGRIITRQILSIDLKDREEEGNEDSI